MENNKPMQFLYVLRNGGTNEYKVGITNNLNKRISALQTGCPNELGIIKIWTHTQRKTILKYERVIHRYFEKLGKRIRANGEWFRLEQGDVNYLCKPNSILEQNQIVEEILKQM